VTAQLAADPRAAEAPNTQPGTLVVLALATAAMLGILGAVAINPFIPDIADDLDASVPVLGQIETIGTLLAAPFGLLVAPLAARFGHRRLIIIGLVATAVAGLLSAVAPVFAMLLAAQLLALLGVAILALLPLALVASLCVGDAQRRSMSWVIGGLSVAGIVGIPLLTLVGQLASWRVAFLVQGGLAAAGVALLVAVVPRRAPASSAPLRPRVIAAAYRPIASDRAMRVLMGASALRATCWVGVLIYLGAFLDHELGLDTHEIGWVYMVAASGYLAGSLAAGGRLGRLPLRPLFALSSLAMGLSLGAMLVLPFGAVGAVVLATAGAFAGGVGYVALTAMLASETPGAHAPTLALNGAAFNIGSAFGGAAGGILIAAGGYAALGLGLPLFALASAVTTWFTGRERAAEPSAPLDLSTAL
jgi:DHA1 family inner membrane transport protein